MDEEPVSSKNKCQKEENRMYSLKPILKQYCIKNRERKKNEMPDMIILQVMENCLLPYKPFNNQD